MTNELYLGLLKQYLLVLPERFEKYFFSLSDQDKKTILNNLDHLDLKRFISWLSLSKKARVLGFLEQEQLDFLFIILDKYEISLLKEFYAINFKSRQEISKRPGLYPYGVKSILAKEIVGMLRMPFTAKEDDTVALAIKQLSMTIQTIYKYIFIVNENNQLTNIIDIEDLFNAKKYFKIKQMPENELFYINVHRANEVQIDHLFTHFSLIPIVDNHKRLMGILKTESWQKYKLTRNKNLMTLDSTFSSLVALLDSALSFMSVQKSKVHVVS